MTDLKTKKKVVEVEVAVPEVAPAHVEARASFVANCVAGIATAKEYAATLGELFTGFDWIDYKGNSKALTCKMTQPQFDAVKGERATLKAAFDLAKLKNFDSKWQYVIANSAITIERNRKQDIKDIADAVAAAKAAADAVANGDTPEVATPEGGTSEKTDLERMLQHLDDALRLATKEGCGCALTTAEKIRAIQLDEKKHSIMPATPAAADS